LIYLLANLLNLFEVISINEGYISPHNIQINPLFYTFLTLI